MALTLVKETGAGLSTANSYATVAEATSYHEGHLYGTVWTAATAGQQASALVMATRLIDSLFRFSGYRANEAQALQWPRAWVPDPDAVPFAPGPNPLASNPFYGFLDWTSMPADLVNATCELARVLLTSDRTALTGTEGISSMSIAGAVSFDFTPADRPEIIPDLVKQMLSRWGVVESSHSWCVKLVRV